MRRTLLIPLILGAQVAIAEGARPIDANGFPFPDADYVDGGDEDGSADPLPYDGGSALAPDVTRPPPLPPEDGGGGAPPPRDAEVARPDARAAPDAEAVVHKDTGATGDTDGGPPTLPTEEAEGCSTFGGSAPWIALLALGRRRRS